MATGCRSYEINYEYSYNLCPRTGAQPYYYPPAIPLSISSSIFTWGLTSGDANRARIHFCILVVLVARGVGITSLLPCFYRNHRFSIYYTLKTGGDPTCVVTFFYAFPGTRCRYDRRRTTLRHTRLLLYRIGVTASTVPRPLATHKKGNIGHGAQHAQ